MRFITLLIIVIAAAGCQDKARRHVDQVIAVGGATVAPAKLTLPATPAPVVPVPSKYKCENCRDTGWVGDGTVKARCNVPGCPFVPARSLAPKCEGPQCKR
jgi:hypothetical protein